MFNDLKFETHEERVAYMEGVHRTLIAVESMYSYKEGFEDGMKSAQDQLEKMVRSYFEDSKVEA